MQQHRLVSLKFRQPLMIRLGLRVHPVQSRETEHQRPHTRRHHPPLPPQPTPPTSPPIEIKPIRLDPKSVAPPVPRAPGAHPFASAQNSASSARSPATDRPTTRGSRGLDTARHGPPAKDKIGTAPQGPASARSGVAAGPRSIDIIARSNSSRESRRPPTNNPSTPLEILAPNAPHPDRAPPKQAENDGRAGTICTRPSGGTPRPASGPRTPPRAQR